MKCVLLLTSEVWRWIRRIKATLDKCWGADVSCGPPESKKWLGPSLELSTGGRGGGAGDGDSAIKKTFQAHAVVAMAVIPSFATLGRYKPCLWGPRDSRAP